MPLTDVINFIHNKGLVPDWTDFLERSTKDWMLSTIMARLEETCTDIYGPEVRDKIILRAKHWVAQREKGNV